MRKLSTVAALITLALLLAGTTALAGVATLTFNRSTLTNVNDAAGLWQHEGGALFKGATQVGYYTVVRRVTTGGTDAFNTAGTKINLFFSINNERPPQNVVIEGAHDFSSGNFKGSVSAASPRYQWMIGAAAAVTNATTLSIQWLNAGQLPVP